MITFVNLYLLSVFGPIPGFLFVGLLFHGGGQDFPLTFQRRIHGLGIEFLVENIFFSDFGRYCSPLLMPFSVPRGHPFLFSRRFVTCHFFSMKGLDLFFSLILKFPEEDVDILPSIEVSSLSFLEIHILQFWNAFHVVFDRFLLYCFFGGLISSRWCTWREISLTFSSQSFYCVCVCFVSAVIYLF